MKQIIFLIGAIIIATSTIGSKINSNNKKNFFDAVARTWWNPFFSIESQSQMNDTVAHADVDLWDFQ